MDHGYNRPATYRHAEELRKLLNLDIRAYLPRISAAHRDTIHGPIPSIEDEEGLKEFSALMKLEPFQRGMKELAPRVWITALRKVQNPNRAGLDIVSLDSNFGTLKVSPVFYWATPTSSSIWKSITSRTSGTTSTQPRPTKSASAVCTRHGAERPSGVESLHFDAIDSQV